MLRLPQGCLVRNCRMQAWQQLGSTLEFVKEIV
jgi:hypothetical protein